MTIAILSKGASIAITPKAQEVGGSSTKFYIGAGWDTTKGNADLDLLIPAVASGSLVALAYQSSDPSTRVIPGVKLDKDNRGGEGEGDDESGYVDTTALQPGVDELLICLYSYAGPDLSVVANPFVRVCAGDTKAAPEMFRYIVAEAAFDRDTLCVVGRLKKQGDGWHFTADGTYLPLPQGVPGLEKLVSLDFTRPLGDQVKV